MTQHNTVMLVGGSGQVGRQLAFMLRQRHPRLALILAGRDLAKAEAVATPLGATAMHFDLDSPDLRRLPANTLLVALANDAHDRLLREALRTGHALLDITRWTTRINQGLVIAALAAPKAPLVFASSWMAALASLVARWAAQDFARVERIELGILYALADRAGPDSVAYMDRFEQPFWSLDGGTWRQRRAFSDPRWHEFEGPGLQRRHQLYRVDTPDLALLPALTGARSVDVRIGFDSPVSNGMLYWLVRSRLWSLLSRPRFDKLRRAMLYNPGQGGPHALQLQLTGSTACGGRQVKQVQVLDPQGQTHLTALGALLQVEHLLEQRVAPGVHFGEQLLDPARVVAELAAAGVDVQTALLDGGLPA